MFHNQLATTRSEIAILKHIVPFPSDLFGWGGSEHAPEVQKPGADQRCDVERMLDSIVEQGELIRKPEESPSIFGLFWDKYSSAQRDAFNRYRRKLNLREWPFS